MASSFVLGRSRAFATAISISNRQRPFYDDGDHRGWACTHREPPQRAQTPPNTTHRCCNEVVRVRAPERARSRGRGHLGRHGALAASETVKCVDAFAAPSRATAAGPPAQVQDRAGHADFGVGIKFQASHDTLSPRRLDKSPRLISTQALHEGHRGQEAAPLLPRQEARRRRRDARDYWNRAGLHAAHPVRHGERQVGDAPKNSPSCV